MLHIRDQIDSVRWLTVRNVATGSVSPGAAPAFAVLRLQASGSSISPTGDAIYAVEGKLVLEVGKPAVDSEPLDLLAGPGGIPSGGFGLATIDFPAWALYETADGTPAIGEVWGPGANSWKLRKGKQGFRVMGGPVDGRVLVDRQPPHVDALQPASFVEAYLSGSQSITATGPTKIAVASGLVGNGATFDNSASLATLSPAGKYLLTGCVSAEANPAGAVTGTLYCYQNGVSVGRNASTKPTTTAAPQSMAITGLIQAADGDTLGLYFGSTSAGVTWTLRQATFSVVWVAS